MLGLGRVSSSAFSLFEAFRVSHEGTLVLGGPKKNGLNPSPRLEGHPVAMIGSMIALF